VFQAFNQGAQFLQRLFIFFGEFEEYAGVRNLGYELFLALNLLLQAASFL
jgi:hypothetical protein